MKYKGLISPLLILGLAFGALSTPNLIAQDTQVDQQQPPKEIIPPEVKALMMEGMDTKTPNTDIPFEIVKLLYLRTSAPEYFHNVFFFKCKNGDLGFKDIAGQEGAAEEKKEEAIFQTAPTQLVSLNNLFFHFKQLDGPFEKDGYAPFNQKADGISYDAEKQELYSVGYTLPAGEYLMALAITSQDLQTVGIQYFEFSIPSPASFVNELETTPIFFAKKMEQMAAAEQIVTIHKGIFTYGAFQIEPNLDNVFNPGDTLEIFFFIFGAQARPDDPTRVDLEINYSIMKGEETYVRWAPQQTDRPAVSLPLPLPVKLSGIVKTTDEQGNTTETKTELDWETGAYTFSIQIMDKISGVSTTKNIEIEVQ